VFGVEGLGFRVSPSRRSRWFSVWGLGFRV